jgi:signal transduction histidine kinase
MDKDVDPNIPPDDVPPREDPVAHARRLAFQLRGEPGLETVGEALEALSLQLDAARRRLVRFGFDLHDGVLQDVAALGTDLHLFHDQLEMSLSGHEHATRLAGRVEDVIARLVVIDKSLRELATSAESSSLLRGPLTSTLEAAALSYEGSLSIGLNLDRELDDVALTDSQRIALVRIVQGALANVVQHSGATTATVSARCLSEGVEAEIRDDGTGFDIQPTLRQAADNGRIGLVAMRERARMLGGEFGIESKPGGPTRVRVLLPYWRPDPVA